MHAAHRTLVILGMMLTACVQEDEPRLRTHDLVDNRAWERVEGAADPWHSARPAEAALCGDTDLLVEEWGEDVWFDLDTQGCAYVTVRQSLLADVPRGADLSVRIWHFKQSAWEGTFALAYRLGAKGPPEWSLKKEVPAESSLIEDTWPSSRDYVAGDDVYFHLSNHGENSWSLLELSATY